MDEYYALHVNPGGHSPITLLYTDRALAKRHADRLGTHNLVRECSVLKANRVPFILANKNRKKKFMIDMQMIQVLQIMYQRTGLILERCQCSGCFCERADNGMCNRLFFRKNHPDYRDVYCSACGAFDEEERKWLDPN
ncbi:hypothetical protein [Listeria booriae]|uniref:Uncharacterized protein n=1 Tax=Listeria booriae TaxID=1552123 RepID=A0A7X0WGJ1_9LIST|nr:hypothetical protein [Listeria booriae]MBC1228772.1 hypothetical protein [Listeria booriae]MBC1333438.1 hypothetical protein [Listeria booriae]MBC2373608.1 hypothetical protein [Listeria booriae]MBC2388744.1 hypothetical protein [Listeria booriae]